MTAICNSRASIIIFAFLITIGGIVFGEIIISLIEILLPRIGNSSITGTKILVKDTARGIGGDILASRHISEFRTATESTHMTVENIGGNGTLDGACIIDAAAKKVIDVGIVDLPSYVTINWFLTSTSRFYKMPTTYVALGIVSLFCSIRIVGSCEVETLVFTTSY